MATAIHFAKALAATGFGGAIDHAYFRLGLARGGNQLFEDGYGDLDEIQSMLQHIEGMVCSFFSYSCLAAQNGVHCTAQDSNLP